MFQLNNVNAGQYYLKFKNILKKKGFKNFILHQIKNSILIAINVSNFFFKVDVDGCAHKHTFNFLF